LSETITLTKDGFEFTVSDSAISKPPVNGWDFWRDYFPEVFEPFTISFIRGNLDNTKSFLDIGAWLGPMSIYAGKIAKSVVAYEPDQAAFKDLQMNFQLNQTPGQPKNMAITADGNSINLYSRTYEGDSMSNIVGDGQLIGVVQGISLEEAIAEDDFGLIKMDIEGAEATVLPANKELLGDFKIPLVLSFHGPFYKEADSFNRIIDTLSVYSSFYDEEYNQIDLSQVRNGFGTILCT
jgi:FkbM family methyltransferase